MNVKGEKLDMPLKFVHLAKVTVFGEFPMDMLRYDRCMPNQERDAGMMTEYLRGPKTVIVRCYSTVQSPPWTGARWRSFGAEIEPIDSMQAGVEYRKIDKAARIVH